MKLKIVDFICESAQKATDRQFSFKQNSFWFNFYKRKATILIHCANLIFKIT
jgi:hypothetical protein